MNSSRSLDIIKSIIYSLNLRRNISSVPRDFVDNSELLPDIIRAAPSKLVGPVHARTRASRLCYRHPPDAGRGYPAVRPMAAAVTLAAGAWSQGRSNCVIKRV
jgi:hypothetical protein